MPLPNIGPIELLIILAIALLILGPGKLPEVGSAFGRTIREFRKASSDFQDATTLTPQPSTRSQPAREAEGVPPRGTPVDAQDESP